MTGPIDLHVHSCHSDGLATPTRLLEIASSLRIRALALADHDAVSGIDEAVAAASARRIEVIPAVELTVEYASWDDVHLLGYFIDHRDGEFNRSLHSLREGREGRAEAIVRRINEKLAEEGWPPISFEAIMKTSQGAVGRPHIARALIAGCIAADMEDAFRRYLEPCNVAKRKLSISEGIAEIHRLGGAAVLAHPQSITRDRSVLTGLLEELAALGLDGVEAYQNMCREDDSAFLEKRAAEHGLELTGGSDFHGDTPSPFTYRVPAHLLESLRLRARRWQQA